MIRVFRGHWGGRYLALVAIAAAAAVPAASELRRIEAVGAVSVDPIALKGVSSRDAAIRAALREAVARVAHDLLWDTDVPEDLEERLSGILGSDMARFTTRFRILEDRGERPSLFSDDPEVSSEYVVVAEVHVDLESVRKRLREHGLLPIEAVLEHRPRLRVEVQGLRAYRAYQALRRALIEGAGARSVTPLALEAGRALFSVDSEQTPRNLLDGLLAGLPPGLEIIPLRAGADTLVLSATWNPPAASVQGDLPEARSAPSVRLPPGSVDTGQAGRRGAPRN